MCSSPWLIAAYHVLLRLLESRHPPYALNCFKNLKYPKTSSSCNLSITFKGLPYRNHITVITINYYVTLVLFTTFPICQRTSLHWTTSAKTSMMFWLRTNRPLSQHHNFNKNPKNFLYAECLTLDAWRKKKRLALRVWRFSASGGYRSRTDDPLRARQML